MKSNTNEKTATQIRSWDSLPLVLTPDETAAILGICRESVYDLFNGQAIPTVMIGKRKRVPRESLRRLLEG